MKRLFCALSLVLLGNTLGAAAYKYGEYDITDLYVSSPSMLVRVGINGEIKEIWSGMDARRMRHSPLCLDASVFGEIRQGAEWVDLRTLKYHQVGTRPGYIHMESDNGLVSIEIESKRSSDQSPIFIRYTFPVSTEMRVSTHFKHPEFVTEARSEDKAGYSVFSVVWLDYGVPSTGKDANPRLVLATQPLGKTQSIDKMGIVKHFDSTKEVVLCVDSTDAVTIENGSESYLKIRVDQLGGDRDSAADIAANRVSVASDNKKLDRLFDSSIDGVESLQFASGVIIVDFGKYKNSWLRDGSYSIIGLALAGNYPAVDRYFSFWSAQRSFSVGGELEGQQPAIALTAMWYYSRMDPNGQAFLISVWPYVKYYADYYAARIGKEGMLNLGEEWITNMPAPSSWPNAEVYSGLRAAAKVAGKLGNAQDGLRWNEAATKLKAQFSTQAYDKGKERIIPIAGPAGQWYTNPERPTDPHNGPMRDDRVDGGMLNTARLEVFGRNQGIVAVDDPKFASTQAQIIRDLEGPDYSLQGFGPNPGNPHSPKGLRFPNGLPTMMTFIEEFAVQDEWLLGRTDLAWRYLLSGIMNKQGYDVVAMNYSLPEAWDESGASGDPMYAWAHGDFITSTLLLFLGVDLEPEGADLGLAPSLPPGMRHAQINNFHFRNWRLNIDLNRKGGGIDVTVRASNPVMTDPSLELRTPNGEIIGLKADQTAQFTVVPEQYYKAFGRNGNLEERAAIFSRILGGQEPSTDLSKMSPSELQEQLCRIETDYVPVDK